jgi:2,3-bisphosphoglycerate-independent phosphoglycerate mutase
MIFLFLDGLGIGEASLHNPIYEARAEFLPFYPGNLHLPDGTPVKPIDAVLGVEGLPQSASGQTSLFTGENLPKILTRHRDSYPNRLMRSIIKEKNILRCLTSRGFNAVFINAYPIYSRFFTKKHIHIQANGELHFSRGFPEEFKRRISVSTCMMVTNEQPPFNEKDIQAKQSIFQDYSNRWLIGKGLPLPEFSPEQAAEILFQASQRYDFLLYEYFQTDIYAHRRSFPDQVQLVKDLNLLMGRLISLLNPAKDTLVVTSDHGNLEDSSTRSHTRNPVPLLVWGQGSHELRAAITDLTDVTPGILSFFGSPLVS